MSRIIINFSTDSDAFREEDGSLNRNEVGTVINRISKYISLSGMDSGQVKDTNGNTVGTYEFVEE